MLMEHPIATPEQTQKCPITGLDYDEAFVVNDGQGKRLGTYCVHCVEQSSAEVAAILDARQHPVKPASPPH